MALTQELRKRYKQGGGWRELFDMLSTYTRRRSELTAESAVNYTGLAGETVVALLKELASLEVGEFRLGRRGGKTRLIWAYSPRSVGDVARGKIDELEAYYDEAEDEEDAELPTSAEPVALKDLLEATKRALAEKLGIDPAAVEITIRH